MIIILQHQLKSDLAKCFETLKYPAENITVTFSDRPDLCHFQCNAAFRLAKELRRKPLEIAEEIAAEFGRAFPYAKAEAAAPGFINFTVGDEAFSHRLRALLDDPRCGVEPLEKPVKILIDYGGPNIAKPLHVGHMRSAVIGECMKRLARFLGCDVTGDIHLGDWGLQMGLTIAVIQDRYDVSGLLPRRKAGESALHSR